MISVMEKEKVERIENIAGGIGGRGALFFNLFP